MESQRVLNFRRADRQVVQVYIEPFSPANSRGKLCFAPLTKWQKQHSQLTTSECRITISIGEKATDSGDSIHGIPQHLMG